MSRLARQLLTNRAGVAMIEFALSVPLLMTAGLWGTELANLALTHLQVNQAALHLADNLSRIGETSQLANHRIYEGDIDDILKGASIETASLGLFDHGRVIISSLEVDSHNRQYIHWQRCKGLKTWPSHYGDLGPIPGGVGIGPAGEEVIAPKDGAVMFVELVYDYQPLISGQWVGNTTITSTASFMVRENRDLSKLYQASSASPSPVAACANHDSFPTS